MAKRKRKKQDVEQLTLDFDPREKEDRLQKKSGHKLTLQDVEEIVGYYTFYGEFASIEIGQKDLIALGNECLRLRELLEQIEKSEDIDEAKRIAKKGLNQSKRF